MIQYRMTSRDIQDCAINTQPYLFFYSLGSFDIIIIFVTQLILLTHLGRTRLSLLFVLLVLLRSKASLIRRL